jgi:predicted ATP-dependent endonuclease of OLD family
VLVYGNLIDGMRARETVMRYTKFQIENYRAVQKIELDLEKDPLVPIIGVNESGKTTILHAIFAIDP